MSAVDWLVLTVTLLFIVLYGMWKSRGMRNIDAYLRAERRLPWYHVGLSVMATQASAITFLSAPGQGFTDGMRFVQFYFGLPLAMVVLCVSFVPRFHNLNVYTAYEYLEKRFDRRTRTLTSMLFLLQRGLSTGVTIYAPAIILSTILHVDIVFTILFNGVLVIIYTVYGGTKAVSYTQLLQMSIIFASLFLAAYLVVHLLPENVGFVDALRIAGKAGKLQALDLSFDLNNRYNLWSGLIGGFFLQLSYFGTDQSQVGRYLTGSSVSQSRLGLIMNGLVKIPMQFLILLIGVLVFVFYQFNAPPVLFNAAELSQLQTEQNRQKLDELEKRQAQIYVATKQAAENLIADGFRTENLREKEYQRAIQAKHEEEINIRKEISTLKTGEGRAADTNDSNYIFLHFVTKQFPIGVVGLIVAVIFLAAMGSTASGMNSLASSTICDLYRPAAGAENEYKALRASRIATVAWGIFCIGVAFFASRLGNLIEAVNILGSLFYGTILGIFLVAFFVRKVGAKAVFAAAIITELLVIIAWSYDLTAFLWLNLIGCGCVFVLSLAFEAVQRVRGKTETNNN